MGNKALRSSSLRGSSAQDEEAEETDGPPWLPRARTAPAALGREGWRDGRRHGHGEEEEGEATWQPQGEEGEATWQLQEEEEEGGGAFTERYMVQDRVLGSGEFGVVRPCMDRRTGAVWACKTVDCKRREAGERLRAEVRAMEALPPHRHIVGLAGVRWAGGAAHLLLDLCAGGDLFALVKQGGGCTEDQAAWIFRQVASAVAFCHSHGVAHLDVKPENVLVAARGPRPEVRLADFGQAALLGRGGGRRLKGAAGSAFYMAPEVVAGRPFDFAADVWSLGVLLYVVLAGYLPFWAESPQVLSALICEADIDFHSHPWPLVSDGAKSLIRRMMTRNPDDRPSANEVLTHPWLQHFDLHPLNSEYLSPDLSSSDLFPPPLSLSAASTSSPSLEKPEVSVSLLEEESSHGSSPPSSSWPQTLCSSREPSPRSPLERSFSPPPTPESSFFGSVAKFLLAPRGFGQNLHKIGSELEGNKGVFKGQGVNSEEEEEEEGHEGREMMCRLRGDDGFCRKASLTSCQLR